MDPAAAALIVPVVAVKVSPDPGHIGVLPVKVDVEMAKVATKPVYATEKSESKVTIMKPVDEVTVPGLRLPLNGLPVSSVREVQSADLHE